MKISVKLNKIRSTAGDHTETVFQFGFKLSIPREKKLLQHLCVVMCKHGITPTFTIEDDCANLSINSSSLDNENYKSDLFNTFKAYSKGWQETRINVGNFFSGLKVEAFGRTLNNELDAEPDALSKISFDNYTKLICTATGLDYTVIQSNRKQALDEASALLKQHNIYDDPQEYLDPHRTIKYAANIFKAAHHIDTHTDSNSLLQSSANSSEPPIKRSKKKTPTFAILHFPKFRSHRGSYSKLAGGDPSSTNHDHLGMLSPLLLLSPRKNSFENVSKRHPTDTDEIRKKLNTKLSSARDNKFIVRQLKTLASQIKPANTQLKLLCAILELHVSKKNKNSKHSKPSARSLKC